MSAVKEGGLDQETNSARKAGATHADRKATNRETAQEGEAESDLTRPKITPLILLIAPEMRRETERARAASTEKDPIAQAAIALPAEVSRLLTLHPPAANVVARPTKKNAVSLFNF